MRHSLFRAAGAMLLAAGCVLDAQASPEVARGDANAAPVIEAPAAPRQSGDGVWTILPAMPEAVLAAPGWIRPEAYAAARLDLGRAVALLDGAPMEFTPEAARPLVLWLPTPDGSFARFAFVESPIMEDGLRAEYPTFKTYAAQGVDDPAATARADVTTLGLRVQVRSPNGGFLIDPVSRADTTHYAVYSRAGLRRGVGHAWRCHTDAEFSARDDDPPGPMVPSGDVLRRFRFACAAKGEFTQFYGGVTEAMAGIVTITNRISGIYETDFAVRLVLVANNGAIVFPNPASDPYPTGGFGYFAENTAALNGAIGANNFDVGHLVDAAGFGGIASLGSVCTVQKAGGYSSLPAPTGDPFSVDYMAHEMGHQFRAQHTFNSCGGGMGGPPASALEPGSGVTIMGYAGICGSDDLAPHSDPMFHSKSREEILSFVSTTATCRQQTTLSNAIPTVEAGPDYTIPKATPFTLTATGSDADASDVLTFSWEQRDASTSAVPRVGANFPDQGTNPLFRTFPPTQSPARTFPRPANLLANTTSLGETLPVTNRLLRFMCVVRDNRAGGGAAESDTMQITVDDVSGPFTVTSPNTNVSWQGNAVRAITWNVAGTNLAPVSCQSVKIELSLDAGQTWPFVLAAETTNDGSEAVLLPCVSTNQARVRVSAVGNIFFDVSNTNFSITTAPSTIPNIDVASLDATRGVCAGALVIPTGEAYSALRAQWLNRAIFGNCGGSVDRGVAFRPATPDVNVSQLFLGDVLILTEGNALSACELRLVSQFVRAGGGLLVVGESALPDAARVVGATPGAPYTGAANAQVLSATNPVVNGPFGTIPGSTNDLPSANGRVIASVGPNGQAFLRVDAGVIGATFQVGEGRVAILADRDLFSSATIAGCTAGYLPGESRYTTMLNNALAFVTPPTTFSYPGTPCCLGDMDDGSGAGNLDGAITIEDLLYFLARFEQGAPDADLDDGTSSGIPDGGVTIEDLLYYLVRFDAGC